MKKILLPALLALFLPLIGFSQDKPWQTYTSQAGHYSISFPAQPKETVDYDSSGTTVLKINFATYEANDNAVLMAGWIDMSGVTMPDRSIKELLEASRDGATGSMKAKTVNTIATVLTGDPYIEFTFSNDSFSGKDRIYYINKVQYSIIAIYGPDQPLAKQADKFIRSFKHLK